SIIKEGTVPVPSFDPPLRLRLFWITCQRISSIASHVLSEGLSHCGGCPGRGWSRRLWRIFSWENLELRSHCSKNPAGSSHVSSLRDSTCRSPKRVHKENYVMSHS